MAPWRGADPRQLALYARGVFPVNKRLGIERILFAVDWPFVTNKPAVQWMETVPLCDEDKTKILSGNAKRLFKM